MKTSARKTQHAGGVLNTSLFWSRREQVSILPMTGKSLDDPLREEIVIPSGSFSGSGWNFYLIALFLFHRGLNWGWGGGEDSPSIRQTSGRTSGPDQQESQEYASL